MNSVALIGWLVQTPVLKTSAKGVSFVPFTIGVKKYGNFDECDFIDCVVWGGVAEALVLNQKKGDRLGVEGRIEKHSYEKEDGSGMFYKVQVNVSYIDFLSNNKNRGKGDDLY